jgi:transposase-like protein
MTTVLETASSEEITEHLGFDKNEAPADRESANGRNGTRTKTVLTRATGSGADRGPRDREGTFDPRIIKKRQRRLTGWMRSRYPLYAKTLTTGEISAHFATVQEGSEAASGATV